jgi:hypothetical protein
VAALPGTTDVETDGQVEVLVRRAAARGLPAVPERLAETRRVPLAPVNTVLEWALSGLPTSRSTAHQGLVNCAFSFRFADHPPHDAASQRPTPGRMSPASHRLVPGGWSHGRADAALNGSAGFRCGLAITRTRSAAASRPSACTGAPRADAAKATARDSLGLARHHLEQHAQAIARYQQTVKSFGRLAGAQPGYDVHPPGRQLPRARRHRPGSGPLLAGARRP